jgi:hypothetical protein
MQFTESRVFDLSMADDMTFEWEGRPRTFLVRAMGETRFDTYALLVEKGTEVVLVDGQKLANTLVVFFDRDGDDVQISCIEDPEELEEAYQSLLREIKGIEEDEDDDQPGLMGQA